MDTRLARYQAFFSRLIRYLAWDTVYLHGIGAAWRSTCSRALRVKRGIPTWAPGPQGIPPGLVVADGMKGGVMGLGLSEMPQLDWLRCRGIGTCLACSGAKARLVGEEVLAIPGGAE